MPIYIRRFNGFSQKPPVGSVLDSGHPLAKDLVVCALFNEGGGLIVNNYAIPALRGKINVAGSLWKSPPSGGKIGGRVGGTWRNIDTGGGTMADFGSYPNYFEGMKTVSLAVIACFKPDSVTNHGCLGLNNNGTGVANNMIAFHNSNGSGGPSSTNWGGCVTTNGGASFNVASFPALDSTGATLEFVVCTFDGTNVKGYLNGKLQATTAGSGALWNPSGVHFTIGNMFGYAGNQTWAGSPSGYFAAGYLWRRALSASEVEWLYTEPWDMIKRQPASGLGSLAVTTAGGGSLIKERRTLEQFGTRAGSRQLQWR